MHAIMSRVQTTDVRVQMVIVPIFVMYHTMVAVRTLNHAEPFPLTHAMTSLLGMYVRVILMTVGVNLKKEIPLARLERAILYRRVQ